MRSGSELSEMRVFQQFSGLKIERMIPKWQYW